MTDVRVRFAPSPTGYLHVGGLRTALYNYLYARKHGGVFVLRIEDTDRTRFVPGAVEKLIAMLRWCGLTYDEGPEVGGPHAPYLQSERTELYRAAAEKLLDSGHAYRCYCTAERLAAMREGKVETRYDRRCLGLDPGEAARNLAAGMPHTVRLRIPDGEKVVVDDIVRGRVEFDTATMDDQILMKSDGFPTYHLANVVDDHDMRISHVIRGEEWLTSTPKHILLYRALGYEMPRFAHLPLLLNPDRSKLSKRQGHVAVEDYRDDDYFPEALLNFVAFLGWNPGDEREVFSLEDLAGAFSLERVNKSGAIFSLEKLRWFNQEYLRRYPVEDLLVRLKPLLAARGWTGLDDDYLKRAIVLMRDRLTFVHEFPTLAPWLFVDPETYDPEVVRKRWKGDSARLLRLLSRDLGSLAPFEAPALEDLVAGFAAREGLKTGDVVHPLRLAVSGVGKGPGLYEMLETLGKDRCLRRVEKALEILG
jgi:glutamyl-tRNA synthetase